MNKVILDGSNLTLQSIADIARADTQNATVEIAPQAIAAIRTANKYVDKISLQKTVYGINTGFGILSHKKIPPSDLAQLQINLIRSHCSGVGKPFPIDITRAIMLLRMNCLCTIHSGVSLHAVELLRDFINFGITPIVPEKGSVGASGDLAPLAHIALALVGEGQVIFKGKNVSANDAIKDAGLKAITLGPKDGLGLINGTEAMCALGVMALIKAKKLFAIADIAAAMTIDGLEGTVSAFDKKVSQLKPHIGQIKTAENLRKLLHKSQIMSSHKNCGRVQDPYSMRCVPQVHGACKQTLTHAEDIFTIEINAITDNPLLFPECDEVISGGNFHGEALAMAMDYLAMGSAELCSISERRIEKLINPEFSKLPPFLAENAGLNSGLMLAHVTAAALTSENKILCHPASVDNIPTSNDKEDHVSMGITAGRKLHEVLFNLKHVLAIEFICNCQALDFRSPKKTSPALQEIHKLIRKDIPFIKEDRVLQKDIEKMVQLIDNDKVLNLAKQFIRELI